MNKGRIEGTVLKVTEAHVVLLTEEGTFKNVALPKSAERPLIGESYVHVEKKKFIPRRLFQYGTVAAAIWLLILASFAFPFGGKAEEAFVVTIDINPSLELAVDEQYQVIRAEGLNDDGVEILSSLLVEGDLKDVMDRILDETIIKGYILVDEPLISTSVVPLQEESLEVMSIVEETIHLVLEEHQIDSEVSITQEDKELYDEAKQHNLSVNLYKEIKGLQEKGIVKKKNDVKGKSLAELKQMENQQRKEAKQKQGSTPKPNAKPNPKKESNPSEKKVNKEKASQSNEKSSNKEKNKAVNGKDKGKPTEGQQGKPLNKGKEQAEKKKQPAEKKGNSGNGKGQGASQERGNRN
ncbi:anti-sigma-I factor RsgI family protein [Halalkalibacter akibai]|uniref:Anti-sigma factor RsgI-like middle domain-containing protein n=1 Tax=Halalkalibacter akibai (strain ATCC 43226 / DSM 21942 / CIP 109018 / JCM 9157 / 1139) TaxID=1236973 RepID=W4QU24_HALA3|nr:hypothetical protein [Halalkalibacter akibai]GAE34834.1 hypothetical protein JCM9157_1914 [Halalkalibacter akibai JCM 9157]